MRMLGCAVLALTLVGCGEAEKKPENKKDIGTATADISHDTAVLGDAEAAANRVIRNATDCDAAKAAYPETNRTLDELQSKVRTAAGRVTFDALRNQVKTIIQNCP